MVWVFALLAVVCCTLAGSVAADNTYQVAVPQVVASQLNRLVSDGQYEAVRLQVKQYCADTMDVKNVRTTSSAVNSTLSPVAQTYTYTMENCHIHERVQGTEYVVELLNKGKVDIALGCGEGTCSYLSCGLVVGGWWFCSFGFYLIVLGRLFYVCLLLRMTVEHF